MNTISCLLRVYSRLACSLAFSLALGFIPFESSAQVSVTTRHIDSYDKQTFPYEGTRIMFIDEAATSAEQNVFIWSKPAQITSASSQPDELHFRRYKKVGGKWSATSSTTITHKGFISIRKTFKGFIDADKDQSVDAFFIYAKHDNNKKQISWHLLLSHRDQIYTISTYLTDLYRANEFSPNFQQLPASIKAAVMDYWNTLDKLEN